MKGKNLKNIHSCDWVSELRATRCIEHWNPPINQQKEGLFLHRLFVLNEKEPNKPTLSKYNSSYILIVICDHRRVQRIFLVRVRGLDSYRVLGPGLGPSRKLGFESDSQENQILRHLLWSEALYLCYLICFRHMIR